MCCLENYCHRNVCKMHTFTHKKLRLKHSDMHSWGLPHHNTSFKMYWVCPTWTYKQILKTYEIWWLFCLSVSSWCWQHPCAIWSIYIMIRTIQLTYLKGFPHCTASAGFEVVSHSCEKLSVGIIYLLFFMHLGMTYMIS